MLYENLKFAPSMPDWFSEEQGKMQGIVDVEANDELIEELNKIRKKYGYTDLVKSDLENDVWYSFTLVFELHRKDVRIAGFVNHGKEDDYRSYELPMNSEEKTNILFQLLNFLAREAWERGYKE